MSTLNYLCYICDRFIRYNFKFNIVMFKTILNIPGKAGLYKLISKNTELFIVESLTDKKRMPVYISSKSIYLKDIAIYTTGEEEEVPLHKVFVAIKEKENATRTFLNPSAATADELRAYLAEVLPAFDRNRVYPNDIKKLLTWYNLLTDAGINDFAL
ncbi:hypothetical protein Barb6XT_02122 [Bacteroidales bacterium Barb6XT]|nr:hypothetical protein Barb6XT_02122 [Bacteroidales bacterium Barb6XT]